MRYRPLGRTGIQVSEVSFGAWAIGADWGDVSDQDAVAALEAALDAGVNFIDTADVYSEGLSEEITGAAIRNSGRARSDVVLATKVFGAVGKGVNDRGASRGHIMDGVKASLKRLGTDYIDLYQIHGTDPITPVEETVRALDDLVRDGLIRYVGVSNWPAWRIMKALGIADRLGLDRLASLQAYYTIAGRDLERDIAPLLLAEKVGLMVWSPLAGGLLSGKYNRDGSGEGRRANFDFPPVNKDRAFDAIDVMAEIAKDKGVSVARIALAYVLHKPFVSSVIIGAKSVEQLNDNIAASDVVLSADELARLDAVSALPAEYPGWMLERQGSERAASVAKPR